MRVFIYSGLCGNLMSMRRHHKPQEGKTYLVYRCSGTSRAVRACEHMEISAPKIDAIAWDFVCGVLRDLQIVQNAVNAMLEKAAFASPEKAAIKSIEECKALVEQYREDLKTPGLSRGSRAVILEDLSKQTDLLEQLEAELAAIRAGRISYERVMQEYREFVAWCQEFHNYEDAPYKRKRDALRFLGITVYIYKEGSPNGRHVIRVAPPDLMQSIKLIPNIEGTLSRSGS